MLFKNKNKENNDESIDEFFENGISFPQFISILYNLEIIPKVNPNPKNIFQRRENNNIALRYLCQNDDFFSKLNPNLNSPQDKTNLLLDILSKKCFQVNIQEIIDKSNLILKNYQIQNKKELANPSFILRLLNFLTDNEVKIDQDITKDNFNEIMMKCFEIAKVPFFINYESMKINNQNILYIQIQLIFDCYSEKINGLRYEDVQSEIQNKNEEENDENNNEREKDENNDEGEKDENNNEGGKDENNNEGEKDENNNNDENKDEDEDDNDNGSAIKNVVFNIKKQINRKRPTVQWNLIKKNDDIEKNDNKENKEKKVIRRTTISQTKNLFDEAENNDTNNVDQNIDEKEDDPVFVKEMTDSINYTFDSHDKINEINFSNLALHEKKGLLRTIESLANNNFVQTNISLNTLEDALKNDFVPNFIMNYLKIYSIDKVKLTQTSQENKFLSKNNINNIIAVINYLITKENIFKTLVFSFDNPLEIEKSIFILFRAFLNIFFINKSRNEMKDRINLLGSNLYKHFFLVKSVQYNLLAYLVKFLYRMSIENNDKITDMYTDCLKELSIPKVFFEDQLAEVIKHKIYPDSYFYQLQFVFNFIDTKMKEIHVLEVLFNASNKIKKIKCQRYDIIASIVKTKRSFLDLDNQNSSSRDDESYKRLRITKSVFVPLNKVRSGTAYKTISYEKLDNDCFEYWNPPDDNIKLINGILMKKRSPSEIIYDYSQIMSSKITDLNQNENKGKTQLPQIDQDLETKLYKIFIYNEEEKNWEFKKEIFKNFCIDKTIGIGNASAPLVFFAQSNEDDVKAINSNFIYGKYPKLNDEEQIFVYALSDKNLTILGSNMKNIAINTEKNGIKPIFLLLHIPKSKLNLPNLPIIILQIYIFLFYTSDLVIVIVNEDAFYYQIPLTKFVYSISQKYKLANNESLNEKILFVIKNESFNYDTEIAYVIDNNQNYNKMIDGFLVRPDLCIINIDDINTYDMFLNMMINILLNSQNSFSKIKIWFDNLQLINICTIYVQIKINKNLDLVRRMIIKRYEMLKEKSTNNEDPQKETSKVINEIHRFFPKIDKEIQEITKTALYQASRKDSLSKEKNYSFELKQSSRSNLHKIYHSIKYMHFISKNQKERIIRNHKIFLQSELLNIIKQSDQSYAKIFKDNNEILEIQFTKDKAKIEKFFQEIHDKTANMGKTVQNDPLKEKKKKTDYVLKENENLREVQVSVEIGNDLTSLIEQDF